MKIVICGLSITSSWGNGHATTYRGLVREMALRGHEILFLEREKSWFTENRDLDSLPHARVALYRSVEELKDCFIKDIQQADAVIVGSYVQDGAMIGRWVIDEAHGITAFYDLDTPVTLAKLERGECDYLHASLIPDYDVYLSFTGGPTLRRIENEYGSPRARALFCSVDTGSYFVEENELRWDLGYLGTYSQDRQWTLLRLLVQPARILDDRRFVVAGPQYPESVEWGKNVKRIDHVAPNDHRAFYNGMRFTLNITRKDMIQAGYSPSVRLFEAAACGVPIITDYWEGLDTFFELGKEILVARSKDEVLQYLTAIPERERRAIGQRARERVLTRHTAETRARELETYLIETRRRKPQRNPLATRTPDERLHTASL